MFAALTAAGQKKKSENWSKCPVNRGNSAVPAATEEPKEGSDGTGNKDWWPNQLDVSILRQHSNLSDPMGPNFNYAEAFGTLDYVALKKDIQALLSTSQDWWPVFFYSIVARLLYIQYTQYILG